MTRFNITVDFGEVENAMNAMYSVGKVMVEPRFAEVVGRELAANADVAFEQYADARAFSDPEQFHHMYETGQVGDMNGRLFRVLQHGNTVSYEYLENTSFNVTPEGESEHVFRWKAPILEEGRTVTIRPLKEGGVLRWWNEAGNKEFSRVPTVVGEEGYSVTGNFEELWEEFWTGGEARALVMEPVAEDAPRAVEEAVTSAIQTQVNIARPRSIPNPNRPIGNEGVEYLSKGRPVRAAQLRSIRAVADKFRNAVMRAVEW